MGSVAPTLVVIRRHRHRCTSHHSCCSPSCPCSLLWNRCASDNSICCSSDHCSGCCPSPSHCIVWCIYWIHWWQRLGWQHLGWWPLHLRSLSGELSFYYL